MKTPSLGKSEGSITYQNKWDYLENYFKNISYPHPKNFLKIGYNIGCERKKV